MQTINPKLLSWSVDTDPGTIKQAEKTARLPIISGHVSLMPDAHVGLGATVGSVIATENAVIPAAVGVDLGCGMIAVRTDLRGGDLPQSLNRLLDGIEANVPSGVGRAHREATPAADAWFAAHRHPTGLDDRMTRDARMQFGTLGSGNHFVEVCLDNDGGRVWVVLHSGSRGVGNKLASRHIKVAKALAREASTPLEDPDLAWFQAATPEFDAYIADMHWAQEYALGNREAMMDAVLAVLFAAVGHGAEVQRINCHHNFCQREHHGGNDVWVTRKGAIKASTGMLGVIPGSMGTRSYIVRGLGNPLSWESCSHGAGRSMSRTEARRRFTAADLAQQMEGKTWLSGRAKALVDEIPQSYKDIDRVMDAQRDLVEVVCELSQVLNYKGT